MNNLSALAVSVKRKCSTFDQLKVIQANVSIPGKVPYSRQVYIILKLFTEGEVNIVE